MNSMKVPKCFSFLFVSWVWWQSHIADALASRASIVTGANGYLGREVVRVLMDDVDNDGGCIFCLVRPSRLEAETEYWNMQADSSTSTVQVLPYDMQDGGASLSHAMDLASKHCDSTCLYHIASVFGPTEDPVASAKENVKGTEDVVRTMANFPNSRLVLTSSTAAVRGTGQEPLNGKFYTHEDWNTVSQLGENWGGCYQWSKAESERRAWELSKTLNVPMSVMCPSFVFGPPSDTTIPLSSSYSITLVGQWVRGESEVQSRLCVDIRDAAQAHVAAGTRDEAIGKRFVVSSEARVPSKDMAEALQRVCRETKLGDPDKITYDAEFQGGAIPIGSKEVEGTDRLKKYLGIVLRPTEETIYDMGRALLLADEYAREKS